MVWFQSSHGARFWFLISSYTVVCEILELTRSLDEYWTGTCPTQWCSVDLVHMGCQGNDTVRRKQQLQDKDEVIPLPSPKIHSWLNQGWAEQIQAVASVLHPCSGNTTRRKETQLEGAERSNWNWTLQQRQRGKEKMKKEKKDSSFFLEGSWNSSHCLPCRCLEGLLSALKMEKVTGLP